MYQRCFDSAAETIFEQDKTLDFHVLSLAMIQTGSLAIICMIMKQSLFTSKRDSGLIIDSSLYVAHADDIVVVERGRLHAVASDSNSPATTYTCALYGFCFPVGKKTNYCRVIPVRWFPWFRGKRSLKVSLMN